jgi:dCTP deaminase
MILSDGDIEFAVMGGEIGISDYDPARQQPASYDLLLGESFKYLSTHGIRGEESSVFDPRYDESKAMDCGTWVNGSKGMTLHPQEFALGATEETIRIPAWCVGRLEGKSSLARLGLLVHSTAGFLDPGFEGTVTLELFNLSHNTIFLASGIKIAQISFERLMNPARRPYGSPELGSKYQGQQEAEASRYHENYGN